MVEIANIQVVLVQMLATSQPIVYTGVKNTYTKGDLFCIHLDGDIVIKIPLCNIFRIQEDYGFHGSR
jgi:hypothetical protein